MSATVIILPVVHRPSFHDPDWREQFDRELEARKDTVRQAPPRTRPLIVDRQREGER
jgi:hypothetical protein